VNTAPEEKHKKNTKKKLEKGNVQSEDTWAATEMYANVCKCMYTNGCNIKI